MLLSEVCVGVVSAWVILPVGVCVWLCMRAVVTLPCIPSGATGCGTAVEPVAFMSVAITGCVYGVCAAGMEALHERILVTPLVTGCTHHVFSQTLGLNLWGFWSEAAV